MSDDSHAPVDSAAMRRLVKIDNEVRTGRGAATSEAGASRDSREAVLWQLERRWPRGSPASGDSVAATAATVDTVARPTRIGPYLVEREIGRGGYGVVLLARDERTGDEVALKVPRPELLSDPAARERFVREAQAMAAVSHPGVVRIHEVGQFGALDFIASQYCPAGSLADRLTAGPTPFSPVQSAELLRQLALAVEHIHALGVLHRDLKPSNVLLAQIRESADGVGSLPFTPLVTDFGLAKLVEQSFAETGTSVMLGTPLYMAPEQAACAHHLVGPATDVYSLGVILYELLTGRPPFAGPGLLGMLNQLQTSAPTPPRRLHPSVPKELEQICLKCLAKDPIDRYPTAAALEADLGRFLNGAKVKARPARLTRKFVRWCRRPARIAAAGVFAIVLNAGMLLWATFEVPYILLAPNVNVERLPIVVAVSVLAAVFMIPLIVAGIWTTLHHRWAIWAGTTLSALNLLVSIVGLTGLVVPFGNLYDATPLLRVVMFGLITSLMFIEALLYAFACVAEAHLCRHRTSALRDGDRRSGQAALGREKSTK